MPPSALQKQQTASFMAVTGAREKDAQRLLKAAGWNMEQACDSYFAANGTTAPSGKSKDTLLKLFEKYRTPTDDDNVMSVDGTMKYLTDLGVDLETAEILVPLEIVQAPCFGEIGKDGFVDGWRAVGADTIAKQKAHVATQVSRLSSDPELFKKVYRHAFVCSKEKGAKALPLENALVYWELVFSVPGPTWYTGSTDWTAMWLEFLREKWTKSVNKDMWNQTLEFYKKVQQDDTLSFWSEDGAWPGVIDDFVAYAKLKRGDVGGEKMETD